MNRTHSCWEHLAADPALDVALLQEAPKAGADRVRMTVPDAAGDWVTGGREAGWCAAIAQCSERFPVTALTMSLLDDVGDSHFGLSRAGTLAAARITLPEEELLVVSAYATWDRFHPATDTSWSIQADTSAHRVISDLAALIGSEKPTGIICAGDWNLMYGYGEDGSAYWARRYQLVFDRMEALGIPIVGPQSPNGRQADPWPKELPTDSKNVPTYRTTRGNVVRQLDYVFATRDLHDRLTVTALNDPESWGPSDHCQVRIDLSLG